MPRRKSVRLTGNTLHLLFAIVELEWVVLGSDFGRLESGEPIRIGGARLISLAEEMKSSKHTLSKILGYYDSTADSFFNASLDSLVNKLVSKSKLRGSTGQYQNWNAYVLSLDAQFDFPALASRFPTLEAALLENKVTPPFRLRELDTSHYFQLKDAIYTLLIERRQYKQNFKSNLPGVLDKSFVGRKELLANLHLWASEGQQPILTIVDSGGYGKSATLTQFTHQLKKQPQTFPSVFIWSFYRQGLREGKANTEPFVEGLWKFFYPNDRIPNVSRDFGLVDRLYTALVQNRTLLVLDGLEVVQAENGGIDDATLNGLFIRATEQTQPLTTRILVTSRLPLWMDVDNLGELVHEERIGALPEADCTALLKQLKVKEFSYPAGTGWDKLEYAYINEFCQGHPLSLVLMGKAIVQQLELKHIGKDEYVMQGDTLEWMQFRQNLLKAARLTVDTDSGQKSILARDSARVQSLIDYHTQRWSSKSLPFWILRIAALIERPIERDYLIQLVAAEEDIAQQFTEPDFELALIELQKVSVIAKQGKWISTHPIIREVVFQEFRKEADKFRRTNLRIIDYYETLYKSGFTDLPKLEDLDIALMLIRHAVYIEEFNYAYNNIYEEEFNRNESYVTSTLGAFRLDKLAISEIAQFDNQKWQTLDVDIRYPIAMSNYMSAVYLCNIPFAVQLIEKVKDQFIDFVTTYLPHVEKPETYFSTNHSWVPSINLLDSLNGNPRKTLEDYVALEDVKDSLRKANLFYHAIVKRFVYVDCELEELIRLRNDFKLAAEADEKRHIELFDHCWLCIVQLLTQPEEAALAYLQDEVPQYYSSKEIYNQIVHAWTSTCLCVRFGFISQMEAHFQNFKHYLNLTSDTLIRFTLVNEMVFVLIEAQLNQPTIPLSEHLVELLDRLRLFNQNTVVPLYKADWALIQAYDYAVHKGDKLKAITSLKKFDELSEAYSYGLRVNLRNRLTSHPSFTWLNR
jgi:hypothetical protein